MGNALRFATIIEWAVTGMLKPHIDKVFAFTDAKAMYDASERGHGRGKKVLQVAR